MSDGNQLPPAGETACPTYVAKRFIQQWTNWHMVTLCHAKFGLVHFIEVHSPSLVVCLFLFSDLFIRKWLAAVKGVLFDGCEPFAIIMIQEKAACPCARFVQQGGAGGFACRSNSHG